MIYLPPPKQATPPPQPTPPPPKAQPLSRLPRAAGPRGPHRRPAPSEGAPISPSPRHPRIFLAQAQGKENDKSGEAPPQPAANAEVVAAVGIRCRPAPVTKDPLTSSPLAAPARHEESQEEERIASSAATR